jgi:hypothetical protein
MARPLPSLPLHKSAEQYYQDSGQLPPVQTRDWLNLVGQLFGMLVVLGAGFKGLNTLVRVYTRDELTNRIFAIDPEAEDSIAALMVIRADIRAQALRSWWNPRDLRTAHLRELESLLSDRVTEAQGHVEARLLSEIRDVRADSSREPQTIRQHLWDYLHSGQLPPVRYELLLRLLEKGES